MASRSEQARQLARALSARYGRDVEFSYDSGDHWYLMWADGPTREQMRAVLDELLPHFPLMASRRIQTSRNETHRAWAARAAAALRDGTLAAWMASHDRLAPIPGDRLTPDEHVALLLIPRLMEETADPDKPSDPADIPVIRDLLATGAAARRYADEYTMVGPLLRLLHGETAVPDPLPDNVTPLFRKD